MVTPSAPPKPTNPQDDELVVEGSTEMSKPAAKTKPNVEELYLNLYSSTSTYGAEWSALFAARTKDGSGEHYETKLYTGEQVKNLNRDGVAHKALHDCEFTVKKWKPASSDNAAVKAFMADVSGSAFTNIGEQEKDKETEEEKASRIKRNKTKQAVVLCCMIDQIIAHMLTNGVKKENIELELKGDAELVQAAYVYIKVCYGFNAINIKCKDNSDNEYSNDKITKVDNENDFGTLIKTQKDKYSVAEDCLKTMYKKSEIKVGGAGNAKQLTNFDDLEERFKFFDTQHGTSTSEAFQNIVRAPSWMAAQLQPASSLQKEEATVEHSQENRPVPSAPPLPADNPEQPISSSAAPPSALNSPRSTRGG